MSGSSRVVLDASALLAYLHRERGGDSVRPLLAGAVVSAVNWSEVLRQALAHRADVRALERDLAAVGTEIAPFDRHDSERAAAFGLATRAAGLSLADCACLALADRLGATAVTADRAWAGLGIEVDVTVIR